MTRRNISVLTLTIAALFLVGTAFAQVVDPGVRDTGVNAGQPLASVSPMPTIWPFSMPDSGSSTSIKL